MWFLVIANKNAIYFLNKMEESYQENSINKIKKVF